ncbi:MAG: hypothetical protein JXB30_13605, partial [Anaerolineae bacterium]|nr:hypothetical protein [Anaerolineae bacterium]
MLSRAVLGEANSEVEQILSAAQAKAKAIRQQAQKQADVERAEILEQGRREAARIRSQAAASAQLEAQTRQLAHREKLLDSVFEAAQQQLPGIQQWTDYEEIAHRLLREALTLLGAAEVRIRADERTQLLLTDQTLVEVSEEMDMQARMGPPLEYGTGVIAETVDGHRQYDNTLET